MAYSPPVMPGDSSLFALSDSSLDTYSLQEKLVFGLSNELITNPSIACETSLNKPYSKMDTHLHSPPLSERLQDESCSETDVVPELLPGLELDSATLVSSCCDSCIDKDFQIPTPPSISPTLSPIMPPLSISSLASERPAGPKKFVGFSDIVSIGFTHAREEYDRATEEIAKLTYRDMLELLTYRVEMRSNSFKMAQASVSANT
ncbi:hypothetical protein QVD99_002648 [Batrachochytrium dendrobatidis]|nr:hypothetical protein O5D80_006873 [Batrachochytrium dendrobatidis]KAK5670878.1 hypothetical protein QVD99_002648 [Batrachochytrium dendrobatidis]